MPSQFERQFEGKSLSQTSYKTRPKHKVTKRAVIDTGRSVSKAVREGRRISSGVRKPYKFMKHTFLLRQIQDKLNTIGTPSVPLEGIETLEGRKEEVHEESIETHRRESVVQVGQSNKDIRQELKNRTTASFSFEEIMSGEIPTAQVDVETISNKFFKKLLLVDVRSAEEYTNNHILFAVNYPYTHFSRVNQVLTPELQSLLNEQKGGSSILSPDPLAQSNARVLCIYDMYGAKDCEKLAVNFIEKGFTKVAILKGGLNTFGHFHSDLVKGEFTVDSNVAIEDDMESTFTTTYSNYGR
ncbi:hypothetical protein PCE1_002260 [Barthelona sp. PCE]